uniref:Integrase zinc-binding domain-containing protein n=1 Tax=Amphimedon queenslandica TaxID=400682 RepID=A0A1X7SKG3_AMPQE
MEQKRRPSHAVTNSYGIHTRKLFQMWDQLKVSQEILFRIFHHSDNGSTIRQLVVPFSLRSDILVHIHAGSVGGYLGHSKSLQKLKDHFYWPDYYNNVIMWCSTCSCATRKAATPKAKAPLDPIMVGSP